jgi:hypothetical protein
VDIGLLLQIMAVGKGEQRQPLGARERIERLDRPQRITTIEPDRTEAIGLGQLLDRPARQAGAHPQIADTVITPAAVLHELQGIGFPEPLDLPQPQPHRVGVLHDILHLAMPG